jgi:AAA domain
MPANTQKISDKVYFFSKPSFKSMKKLAEEGEHLEELRLLFGHFIPESTLIHFPSPRGVGKSWFCMELCIAIAAEWEHFLGETINKHGDTLYINNELGDDVMRRRLQKLYRHVPQPLGSNYRAMVYTTRYPLIDELPNILQIIEKINPVLIVIDNLRMAFTGVDINSNREITRLMFTLLAMCESARASVLVTDHFRKHTRSLLSDSDLQSGSGIKTDLSDGDFFLRKSCQDKKLRILKRGKSRHFEEADSAKLVRLNPGTLWFELVEENVNEAEHVGVQSIRDKEEQKDIARALRAQDKTYEDIARILGKGKATIHRWLKAEEDQKENANRCDTDSS